MSLLYYVQTVMSSVFMKIFSTRLIQLRSEKKLSQNAVACASGIVLRTYQRYENGERLPDIKVACALADFFGVSLDYLCGRSDDR